MALESSSRLPRSFAEVGIAHHLFDHFVQIEFISTWLMR